MSVFFLGFYLMMWIVQGYFAWFFFRKMAFYSPPKIVQTRFPKVSIVVAAHQEYQNLQKLIPALLNQHYEDFEIIITLDRCDDNSAKFLQSISEQKTFLKVIDIQEVNPDFHPKKYALTQAIHQATGEIIVLTDADCMPCSTHWVRLMQEAFEENTEIVIGYSPYATNNSILHHFINYETFWTGLQYLSWGIMGKAYMGVGRNLAYKKSLFMGCGGFGEDKAHIGGDDDIFVGRNATSKNTKVVFFPDAQTISLPKNTWKEWFIQKKRHLSAGKRYKPKHLFTLGALNVSKICFIFSFILLILLCEYPFMVLGIYMVRWVLLMWLYSTIKRRLKDKTCLYLFPFFEFFYLLYYFLIGTAALFSRHTRWK